MYKSYFGGLNTTYVNTTIKSLLKLVRLIRAGVGGSSGSLFLLLEQTNWRKLLCSQIRKILYCVLKSSKETEVESKVLYRMKGGKIGKLAILESLQEGYTHLIVVLGIMSSKSFLSSGKEPQLLSISLSSAM